MRILLSHHGYFPALAGAEQMTEQTARALATRGHDVRIVALRGAAQRESPRDRSLRLVEVDTPDEQQLACAGWMPDVVHAVDLLHTDFALAALALARRLGALFALTPASAADVWGQARDARQVCREADVVFFLTGAERAQLIAAGAQSDALCRIPQAPHVSGAGDASAFRSRYGVGAPMVLFLARKAAFKGYRELLGATSLVWQRIPGATFVFAGPDWDEDCSECFESHSDPRVLDVGVLTQEHKEDALAACEVLCLPSRHEVSPLALLEAWSYGKPVIAGSFPGVEEIVQDGIDGLIVAQDAEQIALAAIALLGDQARAKAMGATGRERVRHGMSWGAVAECVERGYGAR